MNHKKSLSALVGMSLVAGFGVANTANANPFGYTDLAQGYNLAAADETKKPEGKCGEAKCGASKAKQHKASAEKQAEGKCGADHAKMDQEGSCGGDKKAESEKPKS